MSIIYGVADAKRLGEEKFLEEKALLAGNGIELQAFNCLTEDEMIEQMGNCGLIGVVSTPVTRRAMTSLPELKGLFRYGIGVDNIDIPSATQLGIPVCYQPKYCVEDVAGQAFTMLLSLARKVTLLDREIRNGNWSFKAGYPSHRLQGKTLGLAGFGNIARRLAKMAGIFDMEIITYDPYIPDEYIVSMKAKKIDFDELLEKSDFLSIHTPLTPDTRHLFSDAQFAKMKPSAFLINTSRGPVVDTEALIRALQNGLICGAGLDVHENEPLTPDHPLCRMRQVILTPHSGFYTEEAFLELRMSIAQQAADLIQGRKPQYIINPDVLK